jgi:hypothetical protein
MPVSEDEKNAVEGIVDIINGQIRQATVVYNRHAGVVAGKKENEKKYCRIMKKNYALIKYVYLCAHVNDKIDLIMM